MENFPFYDIIKNQLDNKKLYIKSIAPPFMGFSIKITNNCIDKVIDGNGWIEISRKNQYLKIISDCLNKYKINDININVNLPDHPIKGVFNFCRKKNENNCFLLPNSRFAIDDVLVNDNGNTFENYDLQKLYIKSQNIDNKCKIKKIYTSSIPHKSKIDYFIYAIKNYDICDGYCNIGTGHGLVALNQSDVDSLQKINMSGTEMKSWLEHLKYKYVLYNDGNTLSDRMRLLLCSNSLIIRSKSIYEEFYTYKLTNGIDYVEYNNINDLRNIFNYYEDNEEEYHKIVSNNSNFIDTTLTYDNILLYCYYLFNGLSS
jgi:hypothetical protein